MGIPVDESHFQDANTFSFLAAQSVTRGFLKIVKSKTIAETRLNYLTTRAKAEAMLREAAAANEMGHPSAAAADATRDYRSELGRR